MSIARLVFLASLSFLLAHAARVKSYVGDTGSHMSHHANHVVPTALSAVPPVGLQGRLAPKPNVGVRNARETNGVRKAKHSGAVGAALPRHGVQALATSEGDAFTRYIAKQKHERHAHQKLFEQAMHAHLVQNAQSKPPFTERAQVADSFTRRIAEHQANRNTSGGMAVEHQMSEADQKLLKEHAKWFSREFAEFQTKHKDSPEKRAVLHRLVDEYKKLYYTNHAIEPDLFTRHIAQYQSDLGKSREGVHAAFHPATESVTEEFAEDPKGLKLFGSRADRLREREEYKEMLKKNNWLVRAENDGKDSQQDEGSSSDVTKAQSGPQVHGPFSIPAPAKIGPQGMPQETVLEVEKVMLDWWISADKQAQELPAHSADKQYRLMQKLELRRMSIDVATDTADHIFALALGGRSVEHIQAIATVRLEQVRDFNERFRDLARAKGLASGQKSGEYIEMVRIDSLVASPHAKNKGAGPQLLNEITHWAEHQGKLATVFPPEEDMIEFFTSQGFERKDLSWRLVSSSNGESTLMQEIFLDLLWQPNADAQHKMERLSSLVDPVEGDLDIV